MSRKDKKRAKRHKSKHKSKHKHEHQSNVVATNPVREPLHPSVALTPAKDVPYAPYGQEHLTTVTAKLPGGRQLIGQVLFGPAYAVPYTIQQRWLSGGPISPKESKALGERCRSEWRCTMTYLSITIVDGQGNSDTFEGTATCGLRDLPSPEGGISEALKRAFTHSREVLAAVKRPRLTKRERKVIWAAFLPHRAALILSSCICQEWEDHLEANKAFEIKKVPPQTLPPDNVAPKKHKAHHAARPRRVVLASY